MYFGRAFIFDGIPSETYDLRILNFDTGGQNNSNAIGETTLHQKWIYNRRSPYLFGASQTSALKINLTVGSFDTLSGIDSSKISKWLLGKSEYLKLRICQDDLENVYFNVFFTSAENVFFGNVQKGLLLHGICDAPWAWESEKTLTPTLTGDFTSVSFYNDSDDSGYLYPAVMFTMNAGGDFEIINTTDSDRSFLFEDLDAGETITVDCDKQIITTDIKDIYRLSNFNKNFFRLLPGTNELTLTGSISDFSMTYSFARKVGG